VVKAAKVGLCPDAPPACAPPGMCAPACAPPICAPPHVKVLTACGMGEWIDGTSQTPIAPARACVLRMCVSAMPTNFHILPVALTVATS
jgi:hypothetical protein